MSKAGGGKRKQSDEIEDTSPPRKRPLNDAFKSLSLTRGDIKSRAALDGDHLSPTELQDDDVDMREQSSYDKDAHTIVVTSLDDDSDLESQADEEARFIFNLPDIIDTTFSGTKAISAALLERHAAPDNQMVLYKGTPEQVVERALVAKTLEDRKSDAEEGKTLREDDVDAMDLD